MSSSLKAFLALFLRQLVQLLEETVLSSNQDDSDIIKKRLGTE
jgi:hypothetical protein